MPRLPRIGKGASTKGSARGRRRTGSGLKGRPESATRLNEENKRVRMSKDTGAGVMREVASPTSRQAGAKQQNTPAAKKIRKAESKAAADVKQPAMGTPGSTAEAADSGSTSSVPMQRKPKKKVTGLVALGREYDGLTPNAKRGERAKGTKSKYYAVFKQRGMTSPKVQKKAGGGQTLKTVDAQKNPGLAKLPTGVRNKMGYAKTGGQVIKRKKSGRISSSMSGKDLVASCYD